jgi:hypothetical protein
MNSALTINGRMTSSIPKEVKALFAALQLRGGHTEHLEGLNDSEWKSLLSFCERADLTLSLWQIRNCRFPHWVGERLENNAADNAKRFERVKATYLEVADALGKRDIQYVVMKGFAKCPEYVSDPRLRIQSDIDLYCPGDAIHHASDALSAIGYRPDQTVDYSRADHLPTMFRAANWSWRGNAFDPEMPLPVELHYCLWNDKTFRFPAPDLDGFWGRRVMRSFEGFSFPTFSDVDGLGFYALHTLRGLLTGDRIARDVYELSVFINRHVADAAFWAYWREYHDDTLRSMQAIPFCLAKAWFHCHTFPEAETEIDNLSPAIQKWFHNFAWSPLEGMFHPNKDRLWLHLSLLNSSRARRSLFRQVLFPTRIHPLRTPSANFDNFGRARKIWPTQLHVKYLLFYVARSAYHMRATPSALWHGLRWWASQRQLGKQFWIFLTASFFLTWAFRFISSYSISSWSVMDLLRKRWVS